MKKQNKTNEIMTEREGGREARDHLSILSFHHSCIIITITDDVEDRRRKKEGEDSAERVYVVHRVYRV